MTWTIVVTDAEQRAALAAVRSLGRAGHEVHVVSTRERALAGASRYCASETRLPDPLREPDAFVDQLAELCIRVGADVLLPVAEPSLLAVLPHRERFACALPFPTADAFSAICDKALVLRRAVPRGIACPRQEIATSAEDAEHLLSGLTYPIVLKPARSVAGRAGDRKKVSVLYAGDQREASETLHAIIPDAFPVLLQERIEGPGFAISVLMWEGTLRAAFGHRRLREKPPSGGVSVLRDSIPLDEKLLERSVALLRDFDWRGVAMVEFKLDERTGTPYLMEINGRLWGSLQLAIDSGVDFPLLLTEAAMGIVPRTPITTYDIGVRTRWELGDLDHLVARMRHSAAALKLPPGAPGRGATLWAFIRSFGPSYRREVLRFDDLSPFVREFGDWIARR